VTRSIAGDDEIKPGWLKTLGQRVSEMGMRSYSRRTSELRPRTEGAEMTVSVCPYCAVGCSQRVYQRDGQIIDIEGNPDSPINAGTLCPKGAATYQLHVNPDRLTKVRYRAPYSDHWEERPLEWAMQRTAQLVKETRDANYVESADDGEPINHTTAIASLGGATLDDEENYLIKKLLCAGLGIVPIDNQARI
jgi:formate dehydrogenase major subunit